MRYVEIPYGITEAEREVTPDAVGIPHFNRNHYVALPTADSQTTNDNSLIELFPASLAFNANYIPSFRSISIFTDIPNDNYEYVSKDGTALFLLGADKLYLDIDTQSILDSQIKARRLIQWLNSIGIYKYNIFFSGSKGFHIVLNLEDIFGKYTYVEAAVLKELVSTYLVPMTGVVLDLSIYSNRSIIRLPNTINMKTRLYKIEITEQELQGDIGDIEILATNTRELLNVSTHKVSDYSILLSMLELSKDLVDHKLANRADFVNSIDDELPELAFMEEFIQAQELKPGTRHEVSLTLATYYRARGYSLQKAEEELLNFMRNAKGSSTPVAQRLRESRNDIKTCFNRHTRFSKAKALEVIS